METYIPFEMATVSFQHWLDFIYAVPGQDEGSLSLGDHIFFDNNPMLAGCMLEFFECPSVCIKERVMDVIGMHLADQFINNDGPAREYQLEHLFNDRETFGIRLFGTDWLDPWIAQKILDDEFSEYSLMNVCGTDCNFMAIIFDQALAEPPFTNITWLFARYVEDGGPTKVDSDQLKAIFKKATAFYSHAGVGLLQQRKNKDHVAFAEELLCILEAESRLGISEDTQDFSYHGHSFHCTELQHLLTTLMAVALPSIYNAAALQEGKADFQYVSMELAKLPPVVSQAFYMKQTLVFCKGVEEGA